VLLRPDTSGANLILWLAGPAMLVLGAGIGWAAIRRRAFAVGPLALTEAERDRLDEILKS
jgi:cytochrome c-type biogenesis protein CcmH